MPKYLSRKTLSLFNYGHEAILGEGTGTAVFNEWRLNANRWIVSMNDWKWALSSQPNVSFFRSRTPEERDHPNTFAAAALDLNTLSCDPRHETAAMTPELFCVVGLCGRNRIKPGLSNELSNACLFHGSSILGPARGCKRCTSSFQAAHESRRAL